MTPWLELWRQAVRSIRRHRGFSILSIATLALTIGGSSLLLSLYDAIVFRRLPVPRPDELVSVRELSIDDKGREADYGRVALDDFEEMRRAASGLAELGAYATGESLLRAGHLAQRREVQWVDPRYFDVLRVGAARGRVFEASDDPRRGGAGGVLISHDAWRRLFDGEADVVGRRIELDGTPRIVLGVTPAGFFGFQVGANPAVFAPAGDAPSGWAFFRVFGRLREGSSTVALETRLAAVHAAIRARQSDRQAFVIVDGKGSRATERIHVVSGARGESTLRGEASRALLLVGVMLVMLLLILAANLANLLAVRALSERGAAAIRLALGAPRAIVAGSWLAESLLLSLAGAFLGDALAAGLGPSLLDRALVPDWLRGLSFSLDARSLMLSNGFAVGVALLVGGLAAFENARVAPALQLREDSPSATRSRAGVRWRNALISVQVAFSVVLLVATGLFARSVERLLAIDTGYPLDRVLTVRMDFPSEARQPALATLRGLREELSRLPGVSAVGWSGNPLLGGVRGYALAEIEGYTPEPDEKLMLNTVRVDAGYFEALGLPVTGRTDAAAASAPGAGEVVVNRRFAERYSPAASPLGRRLFFGMPHGPWNVPREGDLQVIGVVDDRMVSDVREKPTPRVYTRFGGELTTATVYVRASADPAPLVPSVARLLQERAPEAAAGEVRTLRRQRDLSLRRELLTRDLSLLFGALAPCLAALGLFAVLSYAVDGRRRELALRQALGAGPLELTRHVVGDGLRPVLWGAAAGLFAALALSRLVESELYGVSVRDPAAFSEAIAIVLLAGALASLAPALRAARSDPAAALRAG